MISIRVRTRGPGLRPLQKKMIKLRKPLTRIGRMMVAETEKRFSTERDPQNFKWRRLSPEYRKWKKRKYPGRKILTRTGKLRRSIRFQTHTKSVSIGTKVEYGAYHQLGSPKTNLPRRSFLGLSKSNWASVHKILDRHLGVR